MIERSTIHDVALRAGVSIATVSRVLNNTGKVAEETRKRVLALVAEMNYSPNTAARSLATQRTYTLGMAVYDIAGDFFQHMLRGAEEAAAAQGYNLLIHTTGSNTQRVHLGPHNSDGVIIFADSRNERQILNFHNSRFPVVLLHRSAPRGANIPCVTVDNKNGTRRLIDHLIENCGRRNIAFLRGPDDQEDSYWRELGYSESLAAHNIPYSPDLIGRGEFSIQPTYRTVTHWLKTGTPIDAIFAGDDEAAVGVLEAVKQFGLRVPEDIAVVGFDDIRLSQYLTPPLTTVRAPIEQAAAEAVSQLVKVIEGLPTTPVTILPTELVVRESCGWRQHAANHP